MKLFFSLFLLLLSFNNYASSVITDGYYSVGVPYAPQNSSITWDSNGDLVYDIGYCAVSYQYWNKNKNRPTNLFHYLTNNTGYNGSYYVLTNQYGDSLNAYIEYKDPRTNLFSNFSYGTSYNLGIGIETCYTNSSHAIRISIPENELINVNSGKYTSTFYLNTYTNAGNSLIVTDSFTVTINVNYEIKISNLDDINLGVYDGGVNEIQKIESFCVHTKNSSNYQLTVFDNVSNGFNLVNANNDKIPYKLTYYNDSQNIPININEYQSINNLIGNSYENCDSGTLAYLAVGVNLDSDINVGDYSSTITLIVSYN